MLKLYWRILCIDKISGHFGVNNIWFDSRPASPIKNATQFTTELNLLISDDSGDLSRYISGAIARHTIKVLNTARRKMTFGVCFMGKIMKSPKGNSAEYVKPLTIK